jgi:hypothetical protein
MEYFYGFPSGPLRPVKMNLGSYFPLANGIACCQLVCQKIQCNDQELVLIPFLYLWDWNGELIPILDVKAEYIFF